MRSSLQHLASHSFIHDDSHRLSRTGTIFGRLKRVPKMVFIVYILIGVHVNVLSNGRSVVEGTSSLSLFAPSFLR